MSEEIQEKKKAKKRLSNFDFSKEGCHVSLVGPSMGGPANGITTLMLKALEPTSEEGVTHEEENMENVEMIEKSAHDALVLKAVQEAVAPVQKALEDAVAQLEVFKAAQVAAVEKSRKDALAAVMGADNPELEAEFAIIKSLDEAVFELVLKSKKAANEALEKSAMFVQMGVSGEAETKADTESAEMKILRKLANQA